MIRRTPQARITNQGVNPVGEGKAAKVAGATGPGRNPAQRGRRLASSLAEMAGLLGGTAPAGFTHPARANPLGGGVPGLQAPRFRPEPRKPAPHPGRRDPEAAERLRAALTLATASSHTALQAHRLREAATAPDGKWPRARCPNSLPGRPPAEMVDAQPPRRHGRYCRRTAHPK